MESREPRAAGSEALDRLMRRFADRGYKPSGAEIEDDSAHQPSGHGHGPVGSVREFDHRGHRVQIFTRYEVTIDGRPWEQTIHVQHDGNVMYHGLPQYVVASAVDLIRGVIDHSYEAPENIRAAIRAAQEQA
jgi:hypothetical protein